MDVRAVVNLIQSMTAEIGLSVACMFDMKIYETGLKIADEDFGSHQGVYMIKAFKLKV